MKKIIGWNQFLNESKLNESKEITRGDAYKVMLDATEDMSGDPTVNMEKLKDIMADKAKDEDALSKFLDNQGISRELALDLIDVRSYFLTGKDEEADKQLLHIKSTPGMIETIAKSFSDLLLKEIGSENLEEVVELNKNEKNKDICHSHDFCDANMVMQDAFNSVNIDIESDYPEFVQNQVLTDIWNSAWDLAKAKAFYTSFHAIK